MMAYVLIRVETGSEREVLRKLEAVTGVTEAHGVFGIYDIIIKVEARSAEELNEAIREVKRVDNIRSAIATMVDERLRKSSELRLAEESLFA